MEPKEFLGQTLAWWLDECNERPEMMLSVMLPFSWMSAYPELHNANRQRLWQSRCRMTYEQVLAQEARRTAKHDADFVNPPSLDNSLRLAYDKDPRKERPMMQQPDQPRQDHDSSTAESITFEQNSKGTSVKVRVVKQPGQSDAEWVERIAMVYRQAQSEAQRTDRF